MMPLPVRTLLLPLALSAAVLLQSAAAAAPGSEVPDAGGGDAGSAASSARMALSLEQEAEEEGDPGLGQLLLPKATLESCQDKRHLIAINERLQHDSLLHEEDVDRISSFISRCQALLRRDAGLATGPGRHGRGPHGEPHPSRGWHRE